MTKLEAMANQEKDCLKKAVAIGALGQDDPIENYFADVIELGCCSELIPNMIYHEDTHKFYLKHYDEIEVLREEYEDITGHPLVPSGDLMHWYACYFFEETAGTIVRELGIECDC